MNVSFFLSKKYFVSRRKNTFIQIVSFLSVGGVAVGISSLIVGLSAFNGLEKILTESYDMITPDVKIIPKEGKSFLLSPKELEQIRALPNVIQLSPVIEDYTLALYDKRQSLVYIKGIDPK
ncbi:MAG: ABC transporter permease, partial [Cytophagales bacterium]|nr:ABC transporter permease [Cytophagales bacterium]